ncbi:hypothetical protein GCM10017667_73450 [Streptomyces filamentosus]|uniref:HTH araC/xylS-type domain-containing protein n=1 Tax=Streptomyces filamentosus TaxID=67294 RepID=A0A919BYL8_STRFL|nr:hypothetical protein GCM10017667_73450 [Streptomyces filamentosus]
MGAAHDLRGGTAHLRRGVLVRAPRPPPARTPPLPRLTGTPAPPEGADAARRRPRPLGAPASGRRPTPGSTNLVDPALARLPAYALAARRGLGDAGHFGKVFRAEFGLRPRAVRDRAANRRPGSSLFRTSGVSRCVPARGPARIV